MGITGVMINGWKWRTVYALPVLFWCLFSELRSNEGNKYQHNTWAHKGFVMVAHALSYMLHNIWSPEMTIKEQPLQIEPVSENPFC